MAECLSVSALLDDGPGADFDGRSRCLPDSSTKEGPSLARRLRPARRQEAPARCAPFLLDESQGSSFRCLEAIRRRPAPASLEGPAGSEESVGDGLSRFRFPSAVRVGGKREIVARVLAGPIN